MAIRRHIRVTTLLCSAALMLGACSAQKQSDVEAASAPPPANGMPVSVIEPAAAAPVKTDAQRLASLEEEVARLRSDMSQIMPALTRLTGLVEAQQKLSAADKELLKPAITVPEVAAKKEDVKKPLVRHKVPEPKMPSGAPQGTQKQQPPQTVAVAKPVTAPTTEPVAAPAPQASTPATIPTPVAGKVEQVPSLDALASGNAAPQYASPTPTVDGVPVPADAAAETTVATPSAAPVQTEQAAAAPVPAEAAPAPAPAPVTSTGAQVQNVRFGEHSNKTRIVFDLNKPAKFTYDLDNNEHILLVSLPGTEAKDISEKAVAKMPRVKSYQTSSDGQGGTNVVIKLSRPVKVLMAQPMEASGTDKPRIVFDITNL